jgi:hypothetical protein
VTIDAVTSRAGRRVKRDTSIQIAGNRLETSEALAIHVGTDRNSAREEREVGDYISHVATGVREGFSVQASLEAIVDAIFDAVDLSTSRAILRKSRVAANPWHRVFSEPIVEMAASAAQGVSDVVWQAVSRCDE